MSELPKGWVGIHLDKICHIIRGVTYKKEDAIDYSKSGYIPLYRANNIQNSKLIENELVYIPQSLVKESQLLKCGDIVVAMSSGSKSIVGKAAQYFSNEKKTFGAFCGTLRPIVSVQSKYVGYFTQTKYYRELLSSLSAGANINNLKPAFFGEINVPLAPFTEQTRIVEKLDEVLAQVDTIKARLDGIPAILKRFRQSVLAAAVSGRLTEEWRGSAEYIDIFGLFIPRDWQVNHAKEACYKVQSGSTPRDNPFDQDGTVPFLKVYNIVNQKINFDYKPQFVTVDTHNNKLGRSVAYPFDILMNIVGPPLGKVAILSNQYKEWNINQAITLFRANPELLDYKYLYYVLCEGALVRAVMHETKGSVGQINISLSQCRDAYIPLPSIDEQKEIVRLVDQYFAFADTIETQVKKAQTRVNNLTQSILAKAFRGELVAQDPSDEPAEKLLERIAQARKEAEALAKAAKKVAKTK